MMWLRVRLLLQAGRRRPLFKFELMEAQSQSLRIVITFQGEDPLQFHLNKHTEAALLFDYDRMRKKILQLYKYKAADLSNIQLIVANFYARSAVQIPIHHPKNYKFIVGDMVDRQVESLQLRVAVLGELSKRKRREKQAPIEFDSEGSVESVEDEDIKRYLQVNRPRNAPFKGENELVRCCFCKHSIRQGSESKSSGPLYGPLVGKYYGHLLCLLWCSDVYLDDSGEFKGIEAAITNRMKVKCDYCSKSGASFYCHTISCKKSGHYGCATKHNWYFDWSKYTTYCTKCAAHHRPVVEQSPEKSTELREAQQEAQEQKQDNHGSNCKHEKLEQPF